MRFSLFKFSALVMIFLISHSWLFANASSSANSDSYGVSLGEILLEAAENNPQIAAAWLEYRALKAKGVSERSLPDPKLMFERLRTRSGNEERMFSLSQMFPWPEKLRTRGLLAD